MTFQSPCECHWCPLEPPHHAVGNDDYCIGTSCWGSTSIRAAFELCDMGRGCQLSEPELPLLESGESCFLTRRVVVSSHVHCFSTCSSLCPLLVNTKISAFLLKGSTSPWPNKHFTHIHQLRTLVQLSHNVMEEKTYPPNTKSYYSAECIVLSCRHNPLSASRHLGSGIFPGVMNFFPLFP